MMTEITRSNIYRVLFFISGFLLSILMMKTLVLHTDNTQLMDKAIHYVKTGEWAHFGNRSTKVGSIPGSFLTAITAVPMKIYFSPYSAMAVIILFHLISFLFLYLTFKNQKWFSVLALIIFYWLNPWRLEQVELYNPGYLFFFATLHLYTSSLLLNKSKSKTFWPTVFHILSIGFCMQVHLSFIILACVSSLLFIFKKIKINWWAFFISSAVIVISLIPYFLQKGQQGQEAINLAHSDAFFGRNFVLVYPTLKGIVYFFRMGSLYFGRHIFSEIQFEWIINAQLRLVFSFVFHILKWIIAGVSLFFSIKVIGLFIINNSRALFFSFKSKKSLENYFSDLDFFEIYFYFLFIAALISTAISPVEFNHWHLILCFPAISIFLMKSFSQMLSSRQLAILGVLFIFWGFLICAGSRSHLLSNDYSKAFFEKYESVK